jgi:hypothetical protein
LSATLISLGKALLTVEIGKISMWTDFSAVSTKIPCDAGCSFEVIELSKVLKLLRIRLLAVIQLKRTVNL